MKEIEIKYKLSDRSSVLAALEAAGVEFGEIVHQDDTSYAPKTWTRGQDSIQVPFMRIRREGEKSILTLKQPDKGHLDRIEHETVIDDPVQMKKIVELAGFKQDAHVVKERRKARYQDYEICVDRVEVLGDFIELEKIVEDDANGELVQDELRELLKDILGSLDGLEEVHRGYDVLINEV